MNDTNVFQFSAGKARFVIFINVDGSDKPISRLYKIQLRGLDVWIIMMEDVGHRVKNRRGDFLPNARHLQGLGWRKNFKQI